MLYVMTTTLQQRHLNNMQLKHVKIEIKLFT